MNSIKYKSFAVCIALLVLAGCSDTFLNRYPLDKLTDATYFKNDQEVKMSTTALYNYVWFDAFSDVGSRLGDERAGNMGHFISGSSLYLNESATFRTVRNSWRAYFNVIGNANTIMKLLKEKTDVSVSDTVKNNAIGECYFMRAVAYFYLVNHFENVPILVDNSEVLNKTDLRRNPKEDIWELIRRDMHNAERLLSAEGDAGRVTSWSAKAYLSKIYLFMAGLNKTPNQRNLEYLTLSKQYAGDVIDNGPYKLEENYADLFKLSNIKNSESIFALQWVYNGGYGFQNAFQSYYGFSNEAIDDGTGWGGAFSATYDMLKLYKDFGDSVRRKATFIYKGDVYPDQRMVKYDINGNRTLVPLTYTDDTGAAVKKYIIGIPEDNNGQVGKMNTGMITYMMRLAEVYLIYAEAVLGNDFLTVDPKVLDLVNQLRTRANLQPRTSLDINEIRKEKRIELCMESNAFYELVARSYYDLEGVVNYINNQNRAVRWQIKVFPNNTVPQSWTIQALENKALANEYPLTLEKPRLYLPIPENELAMYPALRDEPVAFDFATYK